MVRSETYRTRKYSAKIDDTSIAQRFRDQKDDMVEQVSAKFAELTLIEMKCKARIEAAGVSVTVIPWYLDFARQCYRIAKQFSQSTRINEVYFRYLYWLNQGLNATILADIAEMCGVDLTEYPAT